MRLTEQQIQQEQRKRYEKWKHDEGEHFEWPVQDSTYENPWEQTRIQWLREQTADVPSYEGMKFKSILEVGCSGGRILKEVNGMFGVDLSPDVIAQNQQLFPDRKWLVRDLTTPTWLRGVPHAHTVICAGTLEHLRFVQALQAVRDFKKIATHRILLTLPDGRDTKHNFNVWGSFKHQFVLTEPKLAELLKVCEEQGWRVTQTEDEASVLIRMDRGD